MCARNLYTYSTDSSVTILESVRTEEWGGGGHLLWLLSASQVAASTISTTLSPSDLGHFNFGIVFFFFACTQRGGRHGSPSVSTHARTVLG